MDTHKYIISFMIFGISAYCKNELIVPKINIGLCNGLLKDADINICCRTENTDNADVTIRYTPRGRELSPFLFRDATPLQCSNTTLNDKAGNSTANLTCLQTRGVKIYKLLMDFSDFYIHGNWTCKSYAGTADFVIDYVADRYEGEITKLTGDMVNLTWVMTGYIDDKFLVIHHNGTQLCSLQGSKAEYQINERGCQVKESSNNKVIVILMLNTISKDGGQYTCVDKTNPFVSFLILTLFEAPKLPKIIPLDPETRGSGNTASQGDKTSVTVYCQTESKVSSSLAYLPKVSVVWKTPPGITCGVNAMYCDVTNIDCSDYTPSIIGCQAHENTSLGAAVTETRWAAVQDFCRTEGRIYIQSTDEAVGVLVGVLAPFGLLMVLVLVLNFMLARYKRGLRPCCCTCRNPCRPFSRLCQFLWSCCTCCRRRRTGERQRLINVAENNQIPRGNHLGQPHVQRRDEAPRVNIERDYSPGFEAAAMVPAAVGQQSFRASSSGNSNRREVYTEVRARLVVLRMRLDGPPVIDAFRRDHVVDDVMSFYSERTDRVVSLNISVSFTGEVGLDAGGVTRDMFTTFWQKVTDIYFQGNIAFVPKYNIQRHAINHFVTLGRIFAHSTVLLQTIPIQVCRCTLQLIIFGDMPLGDHTVEDILLQDFLLYNDLHHRLVLRTALENFDSLSDSQIQIIRDIFAHYEMGNMPRKETFRQSLVQVAYNELCVKPKMVCEQISRGIPLEQKAIFWSQLTFQHIDTLYEDFRPTTQQVMQKLVCLPHEPRRGSREQTCLDNLKRFISTMSQEMLLSFLQFTTAERKVPSGPILVQFTNVRDGLARCPVAHTCNNQLELPNSYTIYEELVAEFSAILTSTEGFSFTLQ